METKQKHTPEIFTVPGSNVRYRLDKNGAVKLVDKWPKGYYYSALNDALLDYESKNYGTN